MSSIVSRSIVTWTWMYYQKSLCLPAPFFSMSGSLLRTCHICFYYSFDLAEEYHIAFKIENEYKPDEVYKWYLTICLAIWGSFVERTATFRLQTASLYQAMMKSLPICSIHRNSSYGSGKLGRSIGGSRRGCWYVKEIQNCYAWSAPPKEILQKHYGIDYFIRYKMIGTKTSFSSYHILHPATWRWYINRLSTALDLNEGWWTFVVCCMMHTKPEM